MTTAATIDSDALNALFDNQNKLDDIFSSIFDEDAFYSNTPSSKDYQTENSIQKDEDYNPYDDYSFSAEDNFFVEKKRSIAHIALPVVLEIAIIYYAIGYFV